jgi:hypothetical protein
MKFNLLLFLVLASLLAVRGQDIPKLSPSEGFMDPRQTVSFYPWIEDGKAIEDVRSISTSILLICWHPAPDKSAGPDGTYLRYQISGLDGYHTKEQVERFLTAFYDLDHRSEVGSKVPNVIVAGNNWGAGLELGSKLKELSKAKSFAVFYAGGWAFSRALLISEPEARLKLIQEAYKKANP